MSDPDDLKGLFEPAGDDPDMNVYFDEYTKYKRSSLFKRLFCWHWYLPIMTGIRTTISPDGNRREDIAVYSKTSARCCKCGKIKK